MKVGRNDPCPCGSGKKYKHCCYDKELAERQAGAIAAKEEAEAAKASEAEAEDGDHGEEKHQAHEKLSYQQRMRVTGNARSFPRSPESKTRVQRGSQRGG